MFETGACRGGTTSWISLRQTGAHTRGDSITRTMVSGREALSPTEGRSVLGRALTNNRDDRCLRRNGHPWSNGWPNFDLASFLDAYYHPKNRTIPAPRRMSAGPRNGSPRVADAARAPNNWTIEHECLVIPVGPTGPGGFQTVSTRRHRKATDRRNRHEEVCSDGGRPVGCCAGRKPHDERVRADDQDWRDRAADRPIRRVRQLRDQWREDCGRRDQRERRRAWSED